MLRENDIKNVRKLFNRHHYVMTTAELLEAKLYYADIKQLLDEGFIERIRRGYYHWIENGEAKEIVIMIARCKHELHRILIKFGFN